MTDQAKVEEDDWDLPFCDKQPGDEGFEECEACQ
jgi:hypothetical protein